MINPSEERFRRLFHSLDAENEWHNHLTDVQLRYAREAAETPDSWLPFLTGIPLPDDAMTDDAPTDTPTPHDVWSISAIVRKRLTFAAIDDDFFADPVDGHEVDQGLMDGDDGGYTDYDQLLREEDCVQRERTAVFRLLGYQGDDIARMPYPLFGGRVRELLRDLVEMCDGDTLTACKLIVEKESNDGYDTIGECLTALESFLSTHEEALGVTHQKVSDRVTRLREEYEGVESRLAAQSKETKLHNMLGVTLPSLRTRESARRPPCDEAALGYRGSGTRMKACPKRPRVPVFPPLQNGRPDTKSLWETLGPRNAIVKNLSLYERVMKLKGEIYKLQGTTPSTKAEPVLEKPVAQKPVLEIRESATASRPERLTQAGVALMLSHAGFSYADSMALDLLAGVFERFVRDTGRALISTRENIDNNAASVAERAGRRRVKSREEVIAQLEVVLERVKGGFPELYNYVQADLMRTEQALREVEARMKHRIRELGGEAVVAGEEQRGEGVVEEDIQLGEGIAFGYLGERVWVDVLDGIKVPREMVKVAGVKEEAMVMDT